MASRSKLPLPKGWTLADVAAIQALQRGEADPEQQKRALDFAIVTLADTYGDTFLDSARESDFAQGKRKVGLLLVMAVKLNLTKFEAPNG